MRVAMIQYIIFWLNNIPKDDQDRSPKEMIMGEQVLDTKLLSRLPFGAYVQVHNDNDSTNTMTQRTTGAINSGPNNMNGSYRFLSLDLGEIIVRRKWTELPLPNDVTARLEDMADSPEDDVNFKLKENDYEDGEDVTDMNEDNTEKVHEELMEMEPEHIVERSGGNDEIEGIPLMREDLDDNDVQDGIEENTDTGNDKFEQPQQMNIKMNMDTI
jgi:hypothetical protein